MVGQRREKPQEIVVMGDTDLPADVPEVFEGPPTQEQYRQAADLELRMRNGTYDPPDGWQFPPKGGIGYKELCYRLGLDFEKWKRIFPTPVWKKYIADCQDMLLIKTMPEQFALMSMFRTIVEGHFEEQLTYLSMNKLGLVAPFEKVTPKDNLKEMTKLMRLVAEYEGKIMPAGGSDEQKNEITNIYVQVNRIEDPQQRQRVIELAQARLETRLLESAPAKAGQQKGEK